MAEERSVGILRRLPWLRSEFRLRTQMSSRTTQLPLALAPLRLRSGSVGVGQDDRVWNGIGEDESVEEISLNLKQENS
jgi:hypothetical protein